MKKLVRSALLEGYTEPIRDALWGHIYLTPGLAALTESSPFMRLHRIMQLGPTLRVYPGATHTRASHSIGVYHLARRLLVHLAGEGADAWLSPEGVRSFLCAALLHDLGHFPYTHSLKELPLFQHEVLTGNLILDEPIKSLVTEAGGDPVFTAAIVDCKRDIDFSRYCDQLSDIDFSRYRDQLSDGDISRYRDAKRDSYNVNTELLFYRKLLSGSLDPDKLDYLSRDARCCGVPYGVQDVDFILSRLHPHPERGVDIDSRGISGVESLLFSKYLMYRAVYWHKAVRAATAMVKKALLGGLESGIISAEELYHLDDQELFTISQQLAPSLSALVNSVRNGRLFSVAAEIPFDEKAHGLLLDLSGRSRLEKSLALEFSVKEDAFIVDLPEPISFESGLFVNDENCFFADSASAFKSDLIDVFVKSLRIIRIFADPAIERDLLSRRKSILQISQKWLKL